MYGDFAPIFGSSADIYGDFAAILGATLRFVETSFDGDFAPIFGSSADIYGSAPQSHGYAFGVMLGEVFARTEPYYTIEVAVKCASCVCFICAACVWPLYVLRVCVLSCVPLVS
eukprot:2745015-Rhodomonas_salina.1